MTELAGTGSRQTAFVDRKATLSAEKINFWAKQSTSSADKQHLWLTDCIFGPTIYIFGRQTTFVAATTKRRHDKTTSDEQRELSAYILCTSFCPTHLRRKNEFTSFTLDLFSSVSVPSHMLDPPHGTGDVHVHILYWLQDKRPHGQKATGQKATGQKATATQLRVYFLAHKYQLTRSLFFHGLHTHTHTPHV